MKKIAIALLLSGSINLYSAQSMQGLLLVVLAHRSVFSGTDIVDMLSGHAKKIQGTIPENRTFMEELSGNQVVGTSTSKKRKKNILEQNLNFSDLQNIKQLQDRNNRSKNNYAKNLSKDPSKKR